MIDHEYTREIICPYCGCEHDDSFELLSPEIEVFMDCWDCKKAFEASCSQDDPTYSTKKLRDQLDNSNKKKDNSK